uniref:Uncharacterized protein n=1 Tax=Panagrolaimus superbus TaxID=310955 RepID=A0A914Y5D1_9BILA
MKYYLSPACNLQLEEGHYINHNDQNVFLGQLNFDTTTASRRNTGYKATSILPEPYVDLLNKARCSGSKALNEELFRQPELNQRFLSKLSRFPKNVQKSAEKFEIFAYLHLVQDVIEADMPVVQNVTISINNKSTHGLDRNTISSIKNGKKLKSIIFINVPYQRNLSIKDKFATMVPVHLVRTKEVEAASKNPKLYKVYIAKVISPSQNQGSTTLIATLEAKIKKEFEGINANEKFSIFILQMLMQQIQFYQV